RGGRALLQLQGPAQLQEQAAAGLAAALSRGRRGSQPRAGAARCQAAHRPRAEGVRAMFRACLAAALFLSAVPSGPAACAAGPGGSLDGGQIPDPVVLAPSGPAVATVVLFSGGGGWSDSDAAVAKRLQGAGAAVIGIDLP